MSFLVLPLDERLVEQVRKEGDARGWKLDVSEGKEQVVVTVAEGGDAAELVAGLPERQTVDVLPVLTREEYAWRRRRRRFLTVLNTSLGLLTLVGWVVPIAGFLKPPLAPLSTPNLVNVGSAAQLAPNSAKRIRFRDQVVLLVQREEGRFFALGGRCTFMDNCQLEWDPEVRRVVCPCHGCAFDVYGNIVEGPPSLPLPTYPIEEVGDQLFVRREH